jgi:choline-sulfatase
MKQQYSLPLAAVLLLLGALLITLWSAPKQYNVVIFAFDGLQAKHLAEYGYDKDYTPNLDSFFKTSYVFTNTVSPASWTVPTFMSIFTSTYPSEHKLTNKLTEVTTATGTKAVTANINNLSPQLETLAQIFKAHGYATGGFTGDSGVGKVFGYNKGFDTYYDATAFGGLDKSIPEAETWLASHKNEKFFMFVHGYDVHGQHTPAAGYDYRYVQKPYTGAYSGSAAEQQRLREAGLRGEKLNLSGQDIAFWRAIYDEKINDADQEFGVFMDDFKKNNLLDNTIIVVLSDHGTEFYEHQHFDHGHTLYGELLNVLFAIHVPGQEGKNSTSLVSTLDLAPTLLKILGLQDRSARQMHGIDLTAAFAGVDVSHDVYSETDYRLYMHKRSITTTDGWKFILTRENGNKELYNLKTDPREQKNLVAYEPKIAYDLEQKLLMHLKEVGDTGPWPLGCLAVYADQCK